MSGITAQDYIEQQQTLEKQARELMPYDPSQCTYSQGGLRQEVYACLTCKERTGKPCGVCFACSIRCHSTHKLVELFTKRDFTCDCGTPRTGCSCRIRSSHKTPLLDLKQGSFALDANDIPSLSNVYNQNYSGFFCSCHKPYNPLEDSNMFQCVFGKACGEDWYHEECLMGLKPGVVPRRKPELNHGVNQLNSLTEPGLDARTDDSILDDTDDPDESVLPMPGFPSLDTFETIVCWKCIAKFQTQFDHLCRALDCEKVYRVESDTGAQRDQLLNGELSSEEPSTKRVKRSYPYSILLRKDYKEKLKAAVQENTDTILVSFLKEFSFMYTDDPVYKPPKESEDESSSLFELGIQNLRNVPVEQAITGIEAYDKIKQKLTEFLKPFAEQKKVVTEDEVKRFFEGIN